MSPSRPTGTDDITVTHPPQHTPTDEKEAAPIDTDPTVHAPPRMEGGSRSEGLLPVVDPSHYSILGELARGGLGRILRARDLRLDRPVALKEMLTPAREADPRFIAEALFTARLQHPAIVPVYEAGRWPGGEPFYSMKLVSGRSLAEVIAERHTLEERLALLPHVLAVTEAMAYAHSERIIHRDLKPANVLVGDFGETVVIDWGLAKDLSREEGPRPGERPFPAPPGADGALTHVGTVMGTPAYMPPEQAAGQPVNERADVVRAGLLKQGTLEGDDGNATPRAMSDVPRRTSACTAEKPFWPTARGSHGLRVNPSRGTGAIHGESTYPHRQLQ